MWIRAHSLSAALKAARHRGVDISSGTAVTEVLLADGNVTGVARSRTSYSAPVVVNCAGAWSGNCRRIRSRLARSRDRCCRWPGHLATCCVTSFALPKSIWCRAATAAFWWARQSKKRDTTNEPTLSRSSACIRRRFIWFQLSPRRACWKRGPDCGQVLPITCRFWGPLDTRLFRRDRSLPRWHPAHADHGAGDGADGHRRPTRI